MDEGGRKQVKFILKEGLIHIVGNHGLPNNNIEGEIEAEGLEGYNLEYSVNNRDYQPLKGKLVIGKDLLKNNTLSISIRAIKGKDVLYFKSDVIPLTHAIIFGKSLEDSYPQVIKLLLKRMNDVEKLLGIKEQEIEKNINQTKEVLHKHMLELVDTFEEINKKGSLF
jgi:hypothetical protein